MKTEIILFIIFILILVLLIYYRKNYERYEGFNNNNIDEATAKVILYQGKVDYIDITNRGLNYHMPPVINFIGKSNKKAKALSIVDNGQVIGILILDSGEGYKSVPKIEFIRNETHDDKVNKGLLNVEEDDKLNNIMNQLTQIKTKLSDEDKNNTTTLSNAIQLSSSGIVENISSMSKSEIEEKAKDYDEIEKANNDAKNKTAEEAKQKLIEIIEYQKKEKQSQIYAKKYNLPPPPVMYTKQEIEQTKKDAQINTIKKLSTYEKAECMILLDNYNTLNQKMQDLGNLAQQQPYLLPQVKHASDVANVALKKYNKKCI